MRKSEITEFSKEKTRRQNEEEPGVVLSKEQIEEYLKNLMASEHSSVTLKSYRNSLELLRRFLPEDRTMRPGTLKEWQDFLLRSGYSVRTVNAATSVANGLMLYLGHRELQAFRLPEKEDSIQPELTRAEYLRLLSAARLLNKKRAYLLIKIFGGVGLSVGDLSLLTAEAVRAGKIPLPSGPIRIPGGIQGELLAFMKEEGISSGPLFLARDGKPQGRTVITVMIKNLCETARVSEEKANPRCLKKLYQTTQDGIRENLSLLTEQVYDRLLEKEQQTIGWE